MQSNEQNPNDTGPDENLKDLWCVSRYLIGLN